MELQKTTTSLAIRELLRKTQPNYVWALWHRLYIEEKAIGMRYNSFCAYFKVLEKLGLVLRTKAPKVEPPVPKYRRVHNFKSLPRAWYSLNPQKLNSPQWKAPERFLYPQVFKLTGRPRGRPAGSLGKKKRALRAVKPA